MPLGFGFAFGVAAGRKTGFAATGFAGAEDVAAAVAGTADALTEADGSGSGIEVAAGGGGGGAVATTAALALPVTCALGFARTNTVVMSTMPIAPTPSAAPQSQRMFCVGTICGGTESSPEMSIAAG